MLFRDRTEAGRILASKLHAYADRPDVLVLGLPRGGVPVAYEVAAQLHVPLDIFLVRKLGVPGRRELALGAIASGGVTIFNGVGEALGIDEEEIDRIVKSEQVELEVRDHLLRDGRPQLEVAGHTVILVDDGLATGSSMRAAVHALRKRQPDRVVVAVPVGSPETCAQIRAEVDELICVRTPAWFYAIGIWYQNFPETTDQEVREFLARAEAFTTQPQTI
jgi:putative phosphoribosyl transferase